MTEPGKSSPSPQPKQPEASGAPDKKDTSAILAERCADLPPPADVEKRERLEQDLRTRCRDLEDRRIKASAFQTETMSFHLGRWGIILLLLYMLAFGSTSTYTLIKIWPADSIAPTPPKPTESNAKDSAAAGRGADTAAATRAISIPREPAYANRSAGSCRSFEACADTVVIFQTGPFPGLTFDFRPPREERRLLFIALFAGGVGSFLSSVLSLATYIGNRELTRSWAIWYLARPPAGMVLALLIYFILRGGLLTPAASNVLSPYGVAAFSGLIGMFVRQATDKLRDVAEAMFSSKVNQERSEPVHTAMPTPSAPPTTPGTKPGGAAPKGPAAPPKPPPRPGGAPGVPASAPTTADAIAAAHVQDPGA